MRTNYSEESITAIFSAKKKTAKKQTSVKHVAKLIFYPEDGANGSLLNVSSHTDYTMLYPRGWQHSNWDVSYYGGGNNLVTAFFLSK
jgi:hypothetical protein